MAVNIGAFWVQAWILSVFLLVAPMLLAHFYYEPPQGSDDRVVASP